MKPYSISIKTRFLWKYANNMFAGRILKSRKFPAILKREEKKRGKGVKL